MLWVRAQPWSHIAPWWEQPGPAPTPEWRTLHIPPEDRTQREDAA